MNALPDEALSAEQPTRWDWWPLARLLTVLALFGAFAHLRFGWTPDLGHALSLPRRSFEVLSFLTLISFGLAHLYLVLIAFPVYAVVTLNDVLYGISLGLARTVLRVRSRWALSISGLAGELLLFGALLYLARRLIS